MRKATFCATFYRQVISFRCEAETLPEVQKAISRWEGILPKLPGTIYMEPGKLGKSRLFGRNDTADLRDDPVLVIPLPRNVHSVRYSGSAPLA